MYLTVVSTFLTLLTTAHATPAWSAGLPRGTHAPPPKSSEFTLAMNMSGYLVPLTAAYFESRAYKNTTVSDEKDPFHDAVILDLTDDPYVAAPPGVYGLAVADPGGSHGFASEVMATIDQQHFDFLIADGQVGHKMTSAAQAWFACTRTIEGVRGAFLSWGTYAANYSAPYGCHSTSFVIQVSNLTRRAGSRWP
ncbi:hypothetical protein KVR01_009297 [Diaporthe batatas]|uniref:uncharacterized protein n=1 Tax=Diaporthe batatas TaxID=748121 RepID=UPI001D03960F|nr:uncharacterized protein KVR01_009297 [Diaporthe batatas]KAG8161033.1 hypothetical protein KVR01_009297 [Diaporthe batatas]